MTTTYWWGISVWKFGWEFWFYRGRRNFNDFVDEYFFDDFNKPINKYFFDYFDGFFY